MDSSVRILWIFGGFYGIKWLNCMQFSYKSVRPSILLQIIGQRKFEGHISKHVAKMAVLWPKIGQHRFGARASHCHNLAIFHPILTNEYTKMTCSSLNEYTKMTCSSRRIEWNKKLSSVSLLKILVFGPYFFLKGLTWTQNYGLKTTLKLLVHVLAIMANSYLKIAFAT